MQQEFPVKLAGKKLPAANGNTTAIRLEMVTRSTYGAGRIAALFLLVVAEKSFNWKLGEFKPHLPAETDFAFLLKKI